MSDRVTIISKLREALQTVVDHPEMIEQKSAAARQRVFEKFTWDVKAQQVVEVYKWVMGRRPDKPSWGMPFGDPAIVNSTR